MPKTDPTGRNSKMGRLSENHVQLPLGSETRVVRAVPSPAGQSTASQCLRDLEYAAGFDDDIYYKLVPSDGGKAVHCFAYWKWGEWAGRYVYALALHGDIESALAALARKVSQVRDGTRTPTKDLRKGPGWAPQN